MTYDFSFPRSRRLKKRAEFLDCYVRGRKLLSTNFILHACTGNDSVRFGLTVSRKVGNAVVRARVKRLIRETLRHFQGSLAGYGMLVVVARSGAAHLEFKDLRAEIYSLLGRLDQCVASV